MSNIQDFRAFRFSEQNVLRCGNYAGHRAYWKLYFVENVFRVIIHTILSIQISPDWWNEATDGDTKRKARRNKDNYKWWHSNAGSHFIYYLDLKDLGEIIRANAHLFRPAIPAIDQWILGIEMVRLPRNLVSHMNFPSSRDFQLMDEFYLECKSLLYEVSKKFQLQIP
jgi:hypothetical protein